MAFTDRKFEITAVALVALMVGGVYSLFKAPQDPRRMDSEIVYEMPRPKHFSGSGFDLDGREIDRNYVNPFAKKKTEAKPQAEVKAAQPAPGAAVKKKTAQKKKSTEEKKKEFEMNVVGGPEGSTLSPDSSGFGGGGRGGVAPTYSQGPTQAAAQTETKAENKTTPEQWKALLLAQPTSENLAKLIQAYLQGDVDQGAYTSIAVELLNSQKADVQALGLDAAAYVFNVAMFSAVAKKVETLSAQNQTQAEAYLDSYGSGTRLNILNAALKSSDSQVVVTAADVIIHGYTQAKNGGNGGTRPGRGEGNSSLTFYAQFIPTFQSLAQSNDASVSSAAQMALNQLQTVVASL